MNLKELLKSLTNDEINFISKLDYGQDSEKHKAELLKVIEKNGEIDFENQSWYPYEVIELGSNWLQKGHEKEFTCCTCIVLKNVLEERDLMNDVDNKLENHSKDYENLPKAYKALIDNYIEKIINKL